MSDSVLNEQKKKFPLIPLILLILLVYFIINDPGRAWTILMVLIAFGAIIFVHELGHFLAAKAVGIKVEEFAIGFGKVLFGWRKVMGGYRIRILPKKISETESVSLYEKVIPGSAKVDSDTEYQFRVFPLGGFVKMLGQEDLVAGTKSDDPRSYMNKSVGKRLIVISAGVVVNIIVGFIMFIGIFSHGVDVPAAVIGQVSKNSPAEKAGLKMGDEIIAINGEEGPFQFRDLMLAGAFLDDNEGMDLTVSRPDGTTETVRVVPEYDEGLGVKLMGIASANSFTIASYDKAEAKDELRELDLQEGDTIIAINHQEVQRHNQDLTVLAPENFKSAPKTITLTVERNVNDEISQHDTVMPVTLAGIGEKPTILGMLPRLKIAKIQENLPAEKAGVMDDDIIVQFGLIKNPTYEELQEVTNAHTGKAIDMVVLRHDNGKWIEKALQVIPKPAPQNWIDRLRGKDNHAIIGVSISPSDLDHPVVAQCVEYAEGEKLDLPRGAYITRINQISVRNWEDMVVAFSNITEHEVEIHYRINEAMDNSLTVAIPAEEDWLHYVWAAELKNMPGLPLKPLKTHLQADSLGEAIAMGAKETYAFISQTYMSLKGILTGNVSPKGFMGPVGILKTTYTVAKESSVIKFLEFMAMINVLIAVFNFLPIPILDGGHAILLLVEKIKGSPVSVKVQEIINYAGLIMIGTLVLYVTYNDLVRAFTS